MNDFFYIQYLVRIQTMDTFHHPIIGMKKRRGSNYPGA